MRRPYRWLIKCSTLDALTSKATQTQQEATLARAKNISRAEARRRTREALRAEDAELQPSDELDAAAEPAATPERRSMFRMPNIREDIKALPSVFRSRRLLWLPLLLLIGGFVLVLVMPGLPEAIAGLAVIYIQLFFGVPQQGGPPLFTFFIAGFLAPRASYLVGLIYGALWGAMWAAILIFASGPSQAGQAGAGTLTSTDPLGVLLSLVMLGIVYGTLAAAFAAWYRDFLRSMQNRTRERRAEQEAKERAKRRGERQAARSIYKKPT